MEDVSFLKKTNISAIYRFDQQVKDIIISASQVALYVFDAKKSKWIKRKVEGACFFYKRKTSPKYGIFILNRLDTTNFIELLNSTMEIQLQEPFILYRNIFKTIFGIWFYDKSECVEMGRVFQQILQELKEKEKNEQEDDDNAEALFKAKFDTPDKLDQKAIETDANSKQKKPSGQPESVRQFFAIASKEATKNQPNSQQSPAQHSNCKKSLASSFQTVVHIEKKQTLPMNQSDYDKNVNVIENNMKSLNLTKASPVAILDGIDQKFLQSPVGGDSQTIEFPELIPPSMLITPLDLTNSVKSFDTQTSSDSKNAKLDLMSKNQMIQAMEYLLKNDAQFVDKLYDAYLKISKN
ncbi:mRNA-decapping enzyme 1A [Planococcus citri]|uniref:mRNA-decapping enzyme 1A n=1 Tax=Planococcus citri TaxID=170843 RepID=UPI0031F84923